MDEGTWTTVNNKGKSKSTRNKNVQLNGKQQPQQLPQPQASLPVPVPQPPKPNNRSNKSKEINLKGANKEGTDMDAFNDNNHKSEINANVLPPNEGTRTVSNDVLNANTIPISFSKLETDKIISETKSKDPNENVTTIKSEVVNDITPVSAAAVITPVSAKPNNTFNVTSIVKDIVPKAIISPFPTKDNRDEPDKVSSSLPSNHNIGSTENAINDVKLELPYQPGQWHPDRPDGAKKYDKDFLMALKNSPASRERPPHIPDNVLQDDRNRQIDGRLSMGGRTDFINPSFQNYSGKSGSQRGTLPKRNSQSGKMGSRGGDKTSNKPQPKVSISLRGDVKLHESENAWKPARFNKGDVVTDDEKKTEILYKKVRSVLNKLTPQKFDTLVNQVRQLNIDNRERLQGVIDLVFEKAIDEPNFSLAYSMMCKEIQNMQVSLEDEKKNLAFRTLLVTRCQMEFEKQSVDETERNKKVKEIDDCSEAEKKKELLFELEDYDRRLRMKSVGTIRFIGELFKQQMLTTSIMRRCLQTLLDNKDEESLECLCKLLTTIGKELESKNVELFTIFDEMRRITEGKRQKVSSRIRFMLQDVIELRDSKWVPRRGDTNPKTIDQIQKEAETEQLNMQVMNMNVRKDDRNSGPRGGSGPRLKVNDDGWILTSRNRQQFSIQTDKMRAPKLPMADEPLGSSQLFGNWVKGASGAKKETLNSSSNIYAALDNIDTEKRTMNSRSNKDPYSSKGPSMERNYKSYDGRGSRSDSHHRETPMRNTGPPPTSAPLTLTSSKQLSSQVATPVVVAPQPSMLQLSEEQIERRIRNALDEFIAGCCTSEEYFQEISSAVLPNNYYKVVNERIFEEIKGGLTTVDVSPNLHLLPRDYYCFSYNYVLEKSQSARLKTGALFAQLIQSGRISLDVFMKGFEDLLSLWEELLIDIPQIWQYFAEDIVHLLLNEMLPISRLHKLLDRLIQSNVAINLLKPLFTLIVKEKGPNFLHRIWQKSGLQLSDFMPATEVQSFAETGNVTFLLGGNAPVGQSPLSYDDIQQKLSDFFQSKTRFDDIVNWISANIENRVTENKFIRALATAIFENSIINNKLQPEVLASHTKLIQKYVDNNTHYELQCLYALQSLIQKLEHPQGLLLAICDKLYEDSTFCQESFIAWESSSDPIEQEGKGVALKQLTSFFTQLKENEEDDDYSSSEDT